VIRRRADARGVCHEDYERRRGPVLRRYDQHTGAGRGARPSRICHPTLQAAAGRIPELAGVATDANAAKDALFKRPGLGYAVAYPFGILGIILAMGLIRALFRISPSDESAQFAKLMRANEAAVTTMNLVVQNTNLNGMKVEDIPGLSASGVVVSRIRKGTEVDNATPDTVVQTGDVFCWWARRTRSDAHHHRDAHRDRSEGPAEPADDARTWSHKGAGRSLDELNLHDLYDVTITRVSRAESSSPSPNFRLQFAARCCCASRTRSKVVQVLGTTKQLNHPQIMPIFVGIALGVLVGSWPFTIGSMPAAVKLGLAGGPLLVAILLSRIGRLGPLIYYMPLSANFMLREVGITLFLACVGIKAGDQLWPR
jgi:putative transport protein